MSDSVWIKSEPTADGKAYVVTVELSDDRAITLSPERVAEYSSAVLAAAQRAEYDAAVARQLTKVTGDRDSALQVVSDVRADRPPLDTRATEPMALDPGVNASFTPFLVLSIDGEPVGQWTVADARQHALAALEAVTAADLDGGYYRTLVSTVQLDEPRARAVVQDLGNYRLEEQS